MVATKDLCTLTSHQLKVLHFSSENFLIYASYMRCVNSLAIHECKVIIQ